MRRWLPLLYGELRRLAHRAMRGQTRRHTLQPTALVHEAYLRIAASGVAPPEREQHLLGLAARAMRAALVDHARARSAEKRGDGRRPGTLLDIPDDERRSWEVLDLNDAIDELVHVDPPLAKLVELRFFGGLSVEETADALSISESTAKRSWRTARAWLRSRLEDGE